MQLALEVIGEDDGDLAAPDVLLVEEQRPGGAPFGLPVASGPLRSFEQPEADSEREAVHERERAQFAGCGEAEDLTVLRIRGMGDGAGQRDVHGDSFEMRRVDARCSRSRDRASDAAEADVRDGRADRRDRRVIGPGKDR
jgi:hypothetical protein